MSTYTSVDAHFSNREYPSGVQDARRSPVGLGLNNGRSSPRRRVDPALAHHQAGWAGILRQRAVEQQCALHASPERPGSFQRDGHRSSEAAQ